MIKQHYVNNQDFYQALVEHKKKVLEAKEKGLEPPQVSNYIGACIFKIATRLATKGNFAGYSYKDEMISDGIENSLLYINNFDPARSQYAFTYFSRIIFRAFLRRIEKEHQAQYIKHKSFLAALGDQSYYTVDDPGDDGDFGMNISTDIASDYVKNFEEKDRQRKLKQKEKDKEKESLKNENSTDN